MKSLIDWSHVRYAGGIDESNHFDRLLQEPLKLFRIQLTYGSTAGMSRTSHMSVLVEAGILSEEDVRGRF